MKNQNKQGRSVISAKVWKMIETKIDMERSKLIEFGAFFIMFNIGLVFTAIAFAIAF